MFKSTEKFPYADPPMKALNGSWELEFIAGTREEI